MVFQKNAIHSRIDSEYVNRMPSCASVLKLCDLAREIFMCSIITSIFFLFRHLIVSQHLQEVSDSIYSLTHTSDTTWHERRRFPPQTLPDRHPKTWYFQAYHDLNYILRPSDFLWRPCIPNDNHLVSNSGARSTNPQPNTTRGHIHHRLLQVKQASRHQYAQRDFRWC